VLAQYFLDQIVEEQNMPPKSFTKDALDELKKINWTGNIRELRNVIERLLILCDQKITGADVITFAKPNKG
jgi:two-component system nitrogen regulation response regulator NtrX